MKYYILFMQFIVTFFLCPLTSFAICDKAITQYSFIDTIIGKDTDDIIDCINYVMDDDIDNSLSSSIPTYNSFLPTTKNTFIRHSKNELVNSNYNLEIKKDIKGITSSLDMNINLVSCH